MVARQLPKLKTRVRFPSPAPRLNMTEKYNFLISDTFDWYLSKILPVVERNSVQPKYGYHGLYTHTNAVVFRGIDYALSLNKNPKPVALACAFHDMARVNDGPDFQHAENAIPIIEKIVKKDIILPDQYKKSIIYAVKNHSLTIPAPDYISACLWDADRTRISWECGFEEVFYTTERAKKVASNNVDEYLNFMRNCMSKYAHTIMPTLNKLY